MGFPDRLAGAAPRIDARLLEAIPGDGGPVADAMRHACRGGKRLRGWLVLESAALHGAPVTGLAPAAAIEALHAYSLVHDDLPCMDDDDLRRGQPTVHRQWDEATAVLAGDALQSLGFGLLAAEDCHPDGAVRARLVAELAQAAGVAGMVGGQALDIAAESAARPLSLDEIIALQRLKTGALFGWSARAGALLAGADPAPMDRYAAALGLAFQIADDLIDATGDAAAAGKAVAKDAAAGKATFVSLMGVEGARARALALVDEARDALSGHGAAADGLREAAAYVVTRDR